MTLFERFADTLDPTPGNIFAHLHIGFAEQTSLQNQIADLGGDSVKIACFILKREAEIHAEYDEAIEDARAEAESVADELRDAFDRFTSYLRDELPNMVADKEMRKALEDLFHDTARQYGLE